MAGKLGMLEGLLDIEWLEIQCAARYVRLPAWDIDVLHYYHRRRMSFDEIADMLSSDSREVYGEDVEELLMRAAVRLSGVRGLGFWSVLSEEFHCPIGRVMALVMSAKMETWRELG